ncbi:MAG: DNA-processing protein DprA, partial [Gemmatimonadota bacterium]
MASLNDVELGALLALAEIDDLGPATVRALVDSRGSARGALRALVDDTVGPRELNLKQRGSVRDVLRGRRPDRHAAETAARAARRLKPDDRLVGYGLPGYPERLRRLHFPPLVLWARGPLAVDAPRSVSIVGTRRATAPARRLARDMASGLAAAGVRVVSGLASGIDGQAHRGALEAGGET